MNNCYAFARVQGEPGYDITIAAEMPKILRSEQHMRSARRKYSVQHPLIKTTEWTDYQLNREVFYTTEFLCHLVFFPFPVPRISTSEGLQEGVCLEYRELPTPKLGFLRWPEASDSVKF